MVTICPGAVAKLDDDVDADANADDNEAFDDGDPAKCAAIPRRIEADEDELEGGPLIDQDEYDSDTLAKRRRLEEVEDDYDRAGVRKARRLRDQVEGKRRCASDYEPEVQQVIARAIPTFRRLSARSPPTQTNSQRWRGPSRRRSKLPDSSTLASRPIKRQLRLLVHHLISTATNSCLWFCS